jgi:drug/metabolite transporter (DMT)-like permease
MRKEDSEMQLSYLRIHLAVILFGITAILGNLIQMSALMIVWWRVCITSLSLMALAPVWKTLKAISEKQLLNYIFIGCLIGLHWITFYGSVKLSNASICLVCMSTTSLFTSFTEPFFVRRSINIAEVISAAIIIPSMILIVANLDGSHIYGVISGLVSAFLAAIFSVLNKVNIKGADAYTISFIELSSAWVMISVMLVILGLAGRFPEVFLPLDMKDWLYLLILSLACTTFAHILTLQALTKLSAFTANMVINLEPVYGILLAAWILGEHHDMNNYFYLGAGMIVVTVLLYPFLAARYSKIN